MAAMSRRALLIEETGTCPAHTRRLLEKEGVILQTVREGHAARTEIEAGLYDVAIINTSLHRASQLELLILAKASHPEKPVLVLSANGSMSMAIEAMRLGAFDFLVRPVSDDQLVRTVREALGSARPAPAAETPKPTAPRVTPAPASGDFHGFVGNSQIMQRRYGLIESVGPSTATVFITGESGTGKEVCADAIHRLSGRADKPFIALNCGAIPAELLESEVFGHLKGSFTGAITDKPGAARQADGGTLFLDEICELPLALQTKLLRFLQTSTVTPVGSGKPVPVDVRIICATNRDPALEVREGRFREDLFYRLHVVPIHLPPLRTRGTDLERLALHFLRKFAALEGKALHDFDADAMAKLNAMHWPGNVRQLENMMRMITAIHNGPRVTAAMVPDNLDPVFAATQPAMETPEAADELWAKPAGDAALAARIAPLIGEELAVVERALIEQTIASCGDSIPKAARILNVSPSTIYRKREAWTKQADEAEKRRAASAGNVVPLNRIAARQ